MGKSKKQSKTKTNSVETNNSKKHKSNPTKIDGGGSDVGSVSSFPLSLLTYNKKKNSNVNNHNNFHHHNQTSSITALIPSAVFVSTNFFSIEECNAWIHHTEKNIGFEQMKSPQTREYAHRECGRIQMNNCWDMADVLYSRMKPMVEDYIMKQEGVDVPNYHPSYGPVGCNGNLRVYKYEKGMSFGRHYDGSNRIDRYDGGNTEITVLIYLSNCEGGATRFYLPLKNNGKRKNNGSDGIAFVPQAGAILMHMHGDRCLEHEADPVLNGVKYVLRTDIVFANSEQVLK